ncbi:MAG TPA: serine hydrolase domain-containing protein [Vicinamibacterales bacterium]|nr:serine hydrolase domain-containing protein [Vicinamibacterales bacterium]
MIRRYASVALLLAACAAAQPAAPDTPAGRVFTAWLTAFNSADRQQIQALDETYRNDAPPVGQTLTFRERTGGFELVRVEKSDETTLVALVTERAGDTIARVELSLDPVSPPKVARMELRAIPRPSDLALPRLSEADALAALAARADELSGKDQFSGALLVARRGKIRYQKAYGRANREAGIPNELNTQFRIGSMNKMFTSIAILQLVEAGKLKLDDPIGKHLSDYPNKDVATKVTVRHLLTHTGGTGDIFGPEFTKNRLTLREHSDYLALYGWRPLGHEPGAEHRYSNYGFVLLGAIIEKVTGMSYYDHVRSAVFKRAGMTATDSLPESETVAARSTGYMRRESAWVSNTDTLPWRGTAAGGGYSTVSDLFRFTEALKSGKLISKTLLAEATRVQEQRYGYGFSIQGEGPLRMYGHGGGAPGMNGDLRVYPELGYVLVGLSNFDPPAASRPVEFFALRMPAAPSDLP